MEGGEGMVAVVRGLQGSGLAVTLLDSGRQFTLLPEAYTHPAPRTNGSNTTASQCANNLGRRESGVQATDGRYTSMYKMMHCHSIPTSPPEQLSEFPPQRADIYPGHGNFIVGGQGSGEKYCCPTKSSEFRGAMCWPDRGSVFSPRPSLQPDSFATSLRKYPNLSQDRSSEIVERLINFTQAKNVFKNNRNFSPARNIDSNRSNQTFCMDTKLSRNTSTEILRRGYQPEVIIRPKRFEESPTREVCRQEPAKVGELESWRKPAVCKTNDVRYLKEISSKARQGIRSLSAQHHNRPERLSPRERCDSANGQQGTVPRLSTDTVNMEIQATVSLTSREMMTLPRIVPSLRTVAVPLTPISSKIDEISKERESDVLNIDKDQPVRQISQINQTKLSFIDIHVQTVSSAVEFSFREKHKRKRKIRSLSEERVQIIELMKYRNASVLKQSGLKSYRSHHKTKPRVIPVEFMNEFENKVFNVDITSKRKQALDKYRPSLTRIQQNDSAQYEGEVEDTLIEVLKSWINLIPLKVKNKFDAQKEKKYIQYDFYNYLKRYVRISPEHIRKDKLKTDILSRLKLIPLNIKSNKVLILNRLAEILITKIRPLCTGRRWDIDINKNMKNNLQELNDSTLILPNEKEVKDFISKYTTLCLQNNSLSLQESLLTSLQDELLDIFTSYVKSMSNFDDDNVKRDITLLLNNYGLSEQEANGFSLALIKYFKQTFMGSLTSCKIRSKTLIVLTNSCCYGSIGNNSDVKVKRFVDDDIVTNEKHYTNELCHQIYDWLNSLRTQIPQSHEKKQEAVSDLAKDIVERHKSLVFNPYNKITDEGEIQYLKYQIFKWINKLRVDGNSELVQRAPDLIDRIKSIPVPKLSKLDEGFGSYSNQFHSSMANKSYKFDAIGLNNTNNPMKTTDNIVNKKVLVYDNNLPCQSGIFYDNKEVLIRKRSNNDGSYVYSHTKKDNVKSNHMTSNEFTKNKYEFNVIAASCASTSKQCCQRSTENSKSIILDADMKSNDELEAEYDQFVQNWVQNIPMKATDFENDAILEKAKLGIYNGLWKVVTKLNCDPVTYYNRFLYEDLLEDAIDDLLNCLPQSSDLESKRHLLKIKFIEKTVSINDQIKENEEASFKNRLIQNIVTDLRKQGLTDNQDGNSSKLHEELQLIKLIDNYLLMTKFKNEDKVISEIYKNKLIKEAKDFLSDLKKNHEKELKNFDVATYETDIITKLNNVSLPSDKTLNQEADDALLGIEIEKWYDDLPIISNNDYTEQYYRMKQRDILAKKIKEIEVRNGLDASDSPIRNEVSKFLEKAPLAEGESLNINFMVEELVNRLKNKAKQNLNTKTIEIQDPNRYDEFIKDIPCCSSFIENPKSNKCIVVQDDDVNKIVQKTQFDEISSGRHYCNDSVTRTQSKCNNSNPSTKQTRVAIQEPPSYRMFEEESPFSSSFKLYKEQWLSLQNSRPDVGTQTHDTIMHTLPPYISTAKDDDSPEKHCQNNIELKQQSHDSYPCGAHEIRHDYKESIDGKNYPTISIKSTGECHYEQVINNPSCSRDVTRAGKVNKQIYTGEEDQSSPTTCSVECQTNGNNNNFANQVTAELNTPLKKDKICEATNISEDNLSVNNQSVSRHATYTKIPRVSRKRRARLAIQENDGELRKCSYNTDEDDDIHCDCIERYLKYRQKNTRYPCEVFDRLPPCLPVVFPYPYFI